VTETAIGLIERPETIATTLIDDLERIRVAIIVHGPALQAGLRAMLESDPGILVASGADDHADESPDVVLVDASSLRLLEPLVLDRWPHTRVILIGQPMPDESGNWREAISGLLATHVAASVLVAAVRAVAAGLLIADPDVDEAAGFGIAPHASQLLEATVSLTPRERQVLDLVARGYPNKSIAYELGITEHTAKFHVGSLLAKFGAASRAEIVTNATRSGVLTF